ncbi:RNA polymerase sigma factor [Wenjunlia tyrosinilytica]|uniref:RNA polymerase sigma factor n=1 Tax=Wenjunlia tyrosinilytica TaxID=1544741 RepID=UPI00166649EA|nr:sigma-70 family RNA polymerase sigma factor [Wenjunlia tyrosinilytica]
MDEWERFEQAFRGCYRQVVRFLWRRLPPQAVEDAASEVFVIAWERWGTLRGDPLPWLYGIARRVAANAVRAQERSARLEGRLRGSGVATVPGVDGQVLSALGAVDVLGHLSARDREVLMLVTWDGLDAGQAAGVLGCSRGAFLVRLHRARRHLECALADPGDPVPERESESADGSVGR